jgi:hypothetical protein
MAASLVWLWRLAAEQFVTLTLVESAAQPAAGAAVLLLAHQLLLLLPSEPSTPAQQCATVTTTANVLPPAAAAVAAAAAAEVAEAAVLARAPHGYGSYVVVAAAATVAVEAFADAGAAAAAVPAGVALLRPCLAATCAQLIGAVETAALVLLQHPLQPPAHKDGEHHASGRGPCCLAHVYQVQGTRHVTYTVYVCHSLQSIEQYNMLAW